MWKAAEWINKRSENNQVTQSHHPYCWNIRQTYSQNISKSHSLVDKISQVWKYRLKNSSEKPFFPNHKLFALYAGYCKETVSSIGRRKIWAHWSGKKRHTKPVVLIIIHSLQKNTPTHLDQIKWNEMKGHEYWNGHTFNRNNSKSSKNRVTYLSNSDPSQVRTLTDDIYTFSVDFIQRDHFRKM